ncbi:hypothetical protein CALCODRAFT_484810 [Calocera cornea HHB12733]|uniref:Uncharacterized protein n=1 Tax=Calocera cornea HHB12733 TaxID=1353952 RepID=A0A165ESD8_9BASI|nr:hypothetical protein CALCODRAFT_484810 [Calocera cornea HHB12733]
MIMIMKIKRITFNRSTNMTSNNRTEAPAHDDMPTIALTAVSSLSRSSLTTINMLVEQMTRSLPMGDIIRMVDEVQLLERQNTILQESARWTDVEFHTRIEFARERLDHEESMIAWTLEQAASLVANHNPELSDRRTSTFAIDQALRRTAEKLDKLERKLAYARQTLPIAEKLRIVGVSNNVLRNAMSSPHALELALRLFRLNELLLFKTDEMARARQEHECAIVLTLIPAQGASAT